MLTTLKDVLTFAEEKNAAIPHFNIDNLETIEAIMDGVEAEQWPVILSVGQGAIKAGQVVYLSDLVKRIASETDIPVVLFLDHGIGYEQAKMVLDLGLTSVMFDGSRLPLEENIRISRQVKELAESYGASIECELGSIGGVEDGMKGGHNLVDLSQVEPFVQAVHPDALAIGIGNAHGMYKAAPSFDFDRIRACRQMKDIPPLVLHGGSGTPDPMIRKAIELGIRKINVATELRMAFMEGLEETVGKRDFYPMLKHAKEKVTAVVVQKIRLFRGSAVWEGKE